MIEKSQIPLVNLLLSIVKKLQDFTNPIRYANDLLKENSAFKVLNIFNMVKTL